jgi:hypothetical protein
MRFEPVTDLSEVPQDCLENYLTIIARDDSDEDPAAVLVRRLAAIFRQPEMDERAGRRFYATAKDIERELLRRKGEDLPLDTHQVYDWNGVAVEIMAMSRQPHVRPWANIRCTDADGATWRKRQPLPFGADWKLIGWNKS